jgi:hypothetical protein
MVRNPSSFLSLTEEKYTVNSIPKPVTTKAHYWPHPQPNDCNHHNQFLWKSAVILSSMLHLKSFQNLIGKF